ncbi:hypothetical protein LCGC14_2886790, partial [marine sediment metagenome]
METGKATAMQQVKEDVTVSVAMEKAIKLCHSLESKADDLLWRISGNHGPSPIAEPPSSPQSVEHRFMQSSDEIVRLAGQIKG